MIGNQTFSPAALAGEDSRADRRRSGGNCTPLADITSRRQAAFIDADLRVAKVPKLANHGDVTDAYLAELARARRLKLATLDDALCAKEWATGGAENPL